MKRIGLQIKMLSNLISRSVDQVISSNHGITGMQGRIIGFIHKRQAEGVFQKDVENEFQIRRPTASEILKLLENKGLIVRDSVDYDARLKRLRLTEAAENFHRDVDKQLDTIELRLRQDVSPEDYETFQAVIDQMMRNLW